MPYIKAERRKVLHVGEIPDNAGELNYMFSRLCKQYLEKKHKSYQHINDCMGALEGCKLELYRIIAIPYEDEKRETNGPVY